MKLPPVTVLSNKAVLDIDNPFLAILDDDLSIELDHSHGGCVLAAVFAVQSLSEQFLALSPMLCHQ